MDPIPAVTHNAYQSRHWKRRYYRRLDSAKRVKIVRLGGRSSRKQWMIGAKLRLFKMASPLKLLIKLKRAYISMMLSFAGHVSPVSDGNPFSGTGVSRSPTVTTEEALANGVLEKKLVFEIIKSYVPSNSPKVSD